MPRRRKMLVGLLLFNALSALGGGVALATGSLGVPTVLLRHTPFDSFLVPGIFLGTVIGGSALLGAIALRAQLGSALYVSAAAGVIMVGWIAGETLLIEAFTWLQGVYLLTGAMIIVASALRLDQVAAAAPVGTPGSADRVHRRRQRDA